MSEPGVTRPGEAADESVRRLPRWLLREFAHARARYDALPPHARMLVTRPLGSPPAAARLAREEPTDAR